jgi:DNA-binding protein Fis
MWIIGGRRSMENLREEINKVVANYLELKIKTAKPVNMPDMAHAMAQSIIDMVMEQNERLQAPLLAAAMACLGEEYLLRRGLVEAKRRDN